MKPLLLPLLAAISLPTAVNAEKIDQEIAEFCLKATDFAGCIKTMSKRTDNQEIVPKEMVRTKINLDYDFHFTEDLCGTCTACIDSCPTKALEEYQIDSRKCISYLSIEKRGDFSDENKNLHSWIYGCDVCQDVCPWNHFSKQHSEPLFNPKPELLSMTNLFMPKPKKLKIKS